MNRELPIKLPEITIPKGYKRPRKIKAMMEAMFWSQGNVVAASAMIRQNPDTHYQWMKKIPDYKNYVDNLPSYIRFIAEDSLMYHLLNKDKDMTKFYLKAKQNYVEKQKIEHEGIEPVQVKVVLNDEEPKEDEDREPV